MLTEVVGPIDHSRKHFPYRNVLGIKRVELLRKNIARISRVIPPGLGLSGLAKCLMKLVNKNGPIAPSEAAMSHHCSNSPRTAAHLIRRGITYIDVKFATKDEYG